MKVLKINVEKKNFLEFLDTIKTKYNLKEISIDFDGAGDSGEMGDIAATTIKDEVFEKFTEEEKQTITEFFENYLNKTGHDWYNNDGGFGNITLNMEDYVIEFDINIRYIESENHSESDPNFVKNYNLK